MDFEQPKQQRTWSVRRSSAEYYMGNSLYTLGTVAYQKSAVNL